MENFIYIKENCLNEELCKKIIDNYNINAKINNNIINLLFNNNKLFDDSEIIAVKSAFEFYLTPEVQELFVKNKA
jgi:hypothetical protein